MAEETSPASLHPAFQGVLESSKVPPEDLSFSRLNNLNSLICSSEGLFSRASMSTAGNYLDMLQPLDVLFKMRDWKLSAVLNQCHIQGDSIFLLG